MTCEKTAEERELVALYRVLTPGQREIIMHMEREMAGQASRPPVAQNVIPFPSKQTA